MKITLTAFFIIFSISTFAQTTEKYQKLTQQAHEFYKSKNYLASAQKYNEALALTGGKSFFTDRYDAACSWALANVPDSAFPHLVKLIEDNEIKNFSYFKDDSNLKSLQKDKRWQELLDLIQQKKDEAEKDFDKPLIALLDSVFDEDQKYRDELDEMYKKYENDSPEIRAHWEKIHLFDSVNLTIVSKILDEKGWLGAKIIGGKGNSTLFLVIQHADFATQVKYLPMMREAEKLGNAYAGSLALLEDRVALKQGKQQIYGSQIGTDDKTGISFVQDLEDPDNVDKRRSEVGLPPLADYVKQWDIVWDVEEYKKSKKINYFFKFD